MSVVKEDFYIFDLLNLQLNQIVRMHYTFSDCIIVSPRWLIYHFPTLLIDDADKYGGYFNSEISFITDENYLSEIVSQMEAVLSGRINECIFGYEVYRIVCDNDYCRCYIVLPSLEGESTEPDSVIPVNEVFQLMKDWRDYILQWNRNQENFILLLGELL